VQASTLVLAKQGLQIIPIEQARYLAEHVPLTAPAERSAARRPYAANS
jgi:hypothetical protein